jgi:hypothetical protein
MEKTLNIILFWPGHAGHFLQFLLSLDNKTYPIHHPDVDISTIVSRKDSYSFKNAVWKNGGWGNFHGTFLKYKNHVFSEGLRIENFLNSALHDTYTTIVTPRNHNDMMTEINKHIGSMTKVNYLIVELSPSLNYVIEDFKESNHGYPTPVGVTPKPEFQAIYDNYKATKNPYVIKLDNLFYGQDTFTTEYTNLNNHLNLPLHSQDALEMYVDWYNERKIARSNVVKP